MPLKIQRASNVVSCTLNTRKSLCRKEKGRGKLTLLLRLNTGVFVPCRAHLECQHLREDDFGAQVLGVSCANLRDQYYLLRKKEGWIKNEHKFQHSQGSEIWNRVGPQSWVEICYDVTFLTSSQHYEPSCLQVASRNPQQSAFYLKQQQQPFSQSP